MPNFNGNGPRRSGRGFGFGRQFFRPCCGQGLGRGMGWGLGGCLSSPKDQKTYLQDYKKNLQTELNKVNSLLDNWDNK